VTHERRDRVYATVLAFATAAFAALAAAVLFWERADRLDVRFVSWVHRTAPETLVDVMEVLTYAGSAAILGPLAIAAGVLFLRSGRSGAALFVLVAFAGSQLIDQGLKAVFRRGRPDLEDPFVQLTTYAFPSGHAFGATATYGALALVLASAAAGRYRRLALLLAAATLILVVGASRVILGRHYLLDVSAGIVGGVALVSALLLALQHAPGVTFPLVLFSGNDQSQRQRLDT
jgi:membrane-associated phospholipid phosphatase